MYLRTIQLTNFKNYPEASFEFNSNVNGIVVSSFIILVLNLVITSIML